MGSFAFQHTWLECSFHEGTLVKRAADSKDKPSISQFVVSFELFGGVMNSL